MTSASTPPFPIARLRYTKSTGQWAIYLRGRNLKFHEYERKRPTARPRGRRDDRRCRRRSRSSVLPPSRRPRGPGRP